MTLKEYIEKLQEFSKENPEYLELEVVYAIDTEGNDFKPVYFDPSILEGNDGNFNQKTVIIN